MTTLPTHAPPDVGAAAPFSSRDGLATLGPAAVALRSSLEEIFTSWAARREATPVLYPSLMRVDDLDRIDYFQKFPHLGLMAAGLTEPAAERLGGTEHGAAVATEVAAADLAPAHYAVPSAACYNVYLDLAGTTLEGGHTVTTVASCARRERYYDELRRLLMFTMREIVCVGPMDAVLDHLAHYGALLDTFFDRLGLPLERQKATDPFFDPRGAEAMSQKLFPVKEEYCYGGELAIASVNFHRNFFGERYGIDLAEGGPAYTGCVAFGVERWLSALADHYRSDLDAARDAVYAAAEGIH